MSRANLYIISLPQRFGFLDRKFAPVTTPTTCATIAGELLAVAAQRETRHNPGAAFRTGRRG